MLRITSLVVILYFSSVALAANGGFADPLDIFSKLSSVAEKNTYEEEKEIEGVKLFERTDLSTRTTTTNMDIGVTYSDYVDIYSPTNNQMIYNVNVPSGSSKIVVTITSTASMLTYIGNTNQYYYYKQTTTKPGTTTLELRIDCSYTSYRIEFQAIWPYYERSNYTIVAQAESNVLTYGSFLSTDLSFMRDAFFEIGGFSNQCNPVSILVSAPTNGLSQAVLQRSCSGSKRSVDEKRQSTCPLLSYITPTQQPFYSAQFVSQGMSYYLFDIDSCVMNGAILRVHSVEGDYSKPFTIQVSNQTKSVCSNKCSGNGVCFEGTCYCQKGYSGSTCSVFSPAGFTEIIPGATNVVALNANSTMRFFYSNFSRSTVNGRNLLVSFMGALNVQIFNRVQKDENIMLYTGVYTFDQPTVYEFCSAGAEGIVIYTISNLGQENTINFTTSFVDRTLALNGPPVTFSTGSFSYYLYRSLMFRVDGSNIDNETLIYATTEGRGISQTVLVSGQICTFWNYRTVGSSTNNYDYGMDKNAYQVTASADSAVKCQTDDPNVLQSDDLFLIVSYQTANFTTIQINDHAGTCPNNCNNAGRCGGNNQCVCITGFTGSDCSIPSVTELFVDQPISVPQSSSQYFFVYYNPVSAPFVIAPNLTNGYVNLQVYRPISQNQYGSYATICSPDGDNSGWWVVSLNAYVSIDIVVRSLDTSSVYNALTSATTTQNYPGVPSVSLKDFELTDGEKVTITIDVPSDALYSTSLTIVDKVYCSQQAAFYSQMTATGYTITIDACQRGAYRFKVESSLSISFNYTLAKENVTTCPNCCSKNGVCNSGVCTCTTGFGGPTCSEEITCNARPNICGYTGGFTVTPLVLSQYSAYGCSIDEIITYLSYAINQQPNITKCDGIYRKTVCDIYFVPCTNTTIADGCIESCHQLADECRCSYGVDRAQCDQIEQVYFAPFKYFQTTPSCGRPPLTTQFLTTQELTTSPMTSHEMTTQALTSSPLTTQPLTTSPLTTQPLTTAPLTTQPITSAPLTTQPVTSSPLTTQAVTSSPLTTQAVTSSPLTSAAVTSSAITSSAVTSQPLTTKAVTSSAVTSAALTTGSLTTKGLTTGASSSSSGTVTTAMSVAARCGTYSYSGQGYFCSADGKGYYQCLEGAFITQSAYRPCPVGTSCKCAQGVDCGTLGLCSAN